jgi:hypothetical protein
MTNRPNGELSIWKDDTKTWKEDGWDEDSSCRAGS